LLAVTLIQQPVAKLLFLLESPTCAQGAKYRYQVAKVMTCNLAGFLSIRRAGVVQQTLRTRFAVAIFTWTREQAGLVVVAESQFALV
jgi:hypothetical protein